MTIRVNDPGRHLELNEGVTRGAHLLLGFQRADQSFSQAYRSSTDSAGRTYCLLIPFGTPISLTVGSGFFQLADSSNKALPTFGTSIPVLIPTDVVSGPSNRPNVTLNVTGIHQ